ncbi:MAG: acetyl-CoA carboxylase, carboxyltransferase subunit beta [Syntrophomonadaceae bacterium]|nr:acetyl-CoA carboxylase, carboxyltransferase subunit beta [Syntrophomonadaceae bacterium]
MIKNTFIRKKYFPITPNIDQLQTQIRANLSTTTCPGCSSRVSDDTLAENLRVCPKCKHHFSISAGQRIDLIADSGSFKEFNTGLSSINILDFPGYEEKLEKANEKSSLQEAIITGYASIGGHSIILAVMDSRFMMASMGSVVGEKVCRAVEHAIETRCPIVICTSSGGARMQEGMISLMQMAKTSAAINKLNEAGLLYISILTHPTTGGVSASFASLADIIIAEPGALVGFAGPRVIKQTIGQQLPEKFQHSEFLLEHGMIDIILERSQIRDKLTCLLNLHKGGNNG